jgi:hypothetical protein
MVTGALYDTPSITMYRARQPLAFLVSTRGA